MTSLLRLGGSNRIVAVFVPLEQDLHFDGQNGPALTDPFMMRKAMPTRALVFHHKSLRRVHAFVSEAVNNRTALRVSNGTALLPVASPSQIADWAASLRVLCSGSDEGHVGKAFTAYIRDRDSGAGGHNRTTSSPSRQVCRLQQLRTRAGRSKAGKGGHRQR